MYILRGQAEITLGNKKTFHTAGQFVVIPPITKHRVKAIDGLTILEVSTPELDDIVRLEDDYGRID